MLSIERPKVIKFNESVRVDQVMLLRRYAKSLRTVESKLTPLEMQFKKAFDLPIDESETLIVTERKFKQLEGDSYRYFNFEIQNIPHVYRDWLFSDYIQVDFVNSNYSLLMGFISKKLGKDRCIELFPLIYEYAKDRTRIVKEVREFVLRDIEEKECIDIDSTIKKKIVAALFGLSIGGFIGWIKEINPGHGHLVNGLNDTILLIWKEVGQLRDFLMLDDDFKNHLFASSTFDGNLSKFVTYLESSHVLILLESLKTLGYRPISVIHDAVEIDCGVVQRDEMDQKLGIITSSLSGTLFYPEVTLKIHDKTESIDRFEQLLKTALDNVDDNNEEDDVQFERDDDSRKTQFEIDPDCLNRKYLKMKKDVWDSYRLSKVMHPISFYYFDHGRFYCVDRQGLKQIFENLRVVIKSKSESFIDMWLKDLDIPTFQKAGLYPNDEECPKEHLNVFHGFDVQKVEVTDAERSDPELQEAFMFFFDHLRSLVDGDANVDEHVQYWVKFFAHLFQYPSLKPGVCMILQSVNQGVGKQLLEQVIRRMIGEDYAWYTSDPENQLFDKFNALPANKYFGVIDENDVVLNNAAVEKFKAFITNTTYQVRKMHTDTYSVSDSNHIIMTTNKSQPTVISNGDRRFVVSFTRNGLISNDRRDKMLRLMKSATLQRLLYEYFMTYPVEPDFDWVRNRPMSDMYNEIRELSSPPELKFFAQWFPTIVSNGIPRAEHFIHPEDRQVSIAQMLQDSSSQRSFRISQENFYKEYSEFMTKSRYAKCLPDPSFVREMLAHFECIRENHVINPNGVRYFKFITRNSKRSNTVYTDCKGMEIYQKTVWELDVPLVLDWMCKRKLVSIEQKNSLLEHF